MYGDNILEDLPEGEEDAGGAKVDYQKVRWNIHTKRKTRTGNLLSGRNSPNILSTKKASRRKKTTKKTNGANW